MIAKGSFLQRGFYVLPTWAGARCGLVMDSPARVRGRESLYYVVALEEC